MKRVLFFVALCCAMLFQTLNAQDIIVTKQSTRIDAKILEISANEVRYKKANYLDGPTFVMQTSEISSIIYANGEVMIMEHSIEANFEKKNEEPFVVLYREFDNIVSQESDWKEVPNLRELLGAVQYQSYMESKSRYSIGDKFVLTGWFLFLTSGATCLWAINSERTGFVLISGALSIISDIFLISGYVKRGVAAGEISRIAEGYNATHNKGTELSLSMSPTLMNNHGQIAPGLGLSLRF